MKRIKVKTEDSYIKEFPDDVYLIGSVLLDNGYTATLEQISILWRAVSEQWEAPWIDPSIHTREELFYMVKPYFEGE